MASKKSTPRRISEVANQEASELKPQRPAVIASRKAEDEKSVKRIETPEIPRHSEIFLPPSLEYSNRKPDIVEKKTSDEYVPPAVPGIRSR